MASDPSLKRLVIHRMDQLSAEGVTSIEGYSHQELMVGLRVQHICTVTQFKHAVGSLINNPANRRRLVLVRRMKTTGSRLGGMRRLIRISLKS